MRIEFIEISNFRKLRSTRVGFANDKTVFVGANNSGKTSAMTALRYFLVQRERHAFKFNDVTLSHWPAFDESGKQWENARSSGEPLPQPNFEEWLPSLDVWLHVEDDEVHYVKDILPTLDWTGGRLGVRLRLEPKDGLKLQADYLAARDGAKAIQLAGAGHDGKPADVVIWPSNLTEFLERSLGSHFSVKAYTLDPAKCMTPEDNLAKPQILAADSQPLANNPFRHLIRINEISAQRGFGQDGPSDSLDDDDDISGPGQSNGTRKLSDQLRRYYKRHINPYDKPETQDIAALKAIEEAQGVFDQKLAEGFAAAISEMEQLGYPGVTDPRLLISTRLRPVDGLNHDSAVQYVIRPSNSDSSMEFKLPETSNGLGYQNLISMVFRLMSFRDAWMRVGKAQSASDASESIIAPLHLVLIEEPEAYLHTQVQQVFIRQAYRVLRNHQELKDKSALTTQLLVSTHSSHIAHECDYASLRYFRRMTSKSGEVSTSRVINLTTVFGDEDDTKRFVTRYLKVIHCDLLFADAAVLIEGPAERILCPHFVNLHPEFSQLGESYITWLEVSGSHAHRLRALIELLGITTLIITDIDSVDGSGTTQTPRRSEGFKTRNATLKTWCPAIESIDELLDASETQKTKDYPEQQFSIRVAYQSPVRVAFKGTTAEALANTLEDAIVFQNIELFTGLEGVGLIAKFRKAIGDCDSLRDLGSKLLIDLKSGGKAELALDLLSMRNPTELRPPQYIRDGFAWLSEQLNRRQKDLGVSTAELAKSVGGNP